MFPSMHLSSVLRGREEGGRGRKGDEGRKCGEEVTGEEEGSRNQNKVHKKKVNVSQQPEAIPKPVLQFVAQEVAHCLNYVYTPS